MRSPNRICTLEQIQVCMLQRRVFRQCNFLIIENNPFSITFDMSNIMATSCIFPNVRNSVFVKGQFQEIAKVLETIFLVRYFSRSISSTNVLTSQRCCIFLLRPQEGPWMILLRCHRLQIVKQWLHLNHPYAKTTSRLHDLLRRWFP